jgi:hypothetical protein
MGKIGKCVSFGAPAEAMDSSDDKRNIRIIRFEIHFQELELCQSAKDDPFERGTDHSKPHQIPG